MNEEKELKSYYEDLNLANKITFEEFEKIYEAFKNQASLGKLFEKALEQSEFHSLSELSQQIGLTLSKLSRIKNTKKVLYKKNSASFQNYDLKLIAGELCQVKQRNDDSKRRKLEKEFIYANDPLERIYDFCIKRHIHPDEITLIVECFFMAKEKFW